MLFILFILWAVPIYLILSDRGFFGFGWRVSGFFDRAMLILAAPVFFAFILVILVFTLPLNSEEKRRVFREMFVKKGFTDDPADLIETE